MTDNRNKQVNEARFGKLFDDTQAMSIQGYRADGTVVYWNAASEKIYGYSTMEALGQSLYDLIIPDEMRDDVQNAVAWMFENQQGIPSARLNLKHKDGSTVPVYSSHTVVALPNEDPIMFCMDADMRALELAEAEVQRLSYYDSLTQLPNRRLLLERLASLARKNNGEETVSALLLIDLDNFHSINDSLGYSSGDRVLAHCANVLRRFSCVADDLARLGKDEYALVLATDDNCEESAATAAERLANDIIRALEKPFSLDENTHKLSACVGITLFRCPCAVAADEILRQADIALKTAKKNADTAVSFFDQQMEMAVKERLQLSQALNHAIERQELQVALQPQVNKHRQLIGFEALLRWQHPRLGAIPPSDFIPLAEASGAILTIGDWVLEQSCKKLSEWQKQQRTRHLSISVNVSSVQFRRGDFTTRVKAILARSGVDPRRIRFELTESLMADDISFIVAQMHNLRDLGVTISLDDFGTGYASLAYLTQLPLDELKIDRAFVRDLSKHGKGELLTETLISLGRSMNLAVIAEGVETHEQFERLQELGCEFFQGYLFGKPSADVAPYLNSPTLR